MNTKQFHVLNNAKQVRASIDEYNRFEGTAVCECVTMLWDHSRNRRRKARCIVIDLGRRPAVTPHNFTKDDHELLALRTQRQYVPRAVTANSFEPPESLAKRLHAWLKQAGAATQHQAATALEITPNQAKHLLTSSAHLFKLWKKIAGQSYFVACEKVTQP